MAADPGPREAAGTGGEGVALAGAGRGPPEPGPRSGGVGSGLAQERVSRANSPTGSQELWGRAGDCVPGTPQGRS